MANLVEAKETINDTGRLEQMRGRITELGIVNLAVLGPEGSSGDKLAKELGGVGVRHCESYSAVLAALDDPGTGALMPMVTVDGKPVMHDAAGKTSNTDAWAKAKKASVGSIQNLHDEPPTVTKLLIG